MNDLAAALLALEGGGELGWALGVVTDTTPFTVQLNGDTVDIVSPPRCASYTPTLNDIVFVLRPAGSGVLVVDQIV